MANCKPLLMLHGYDFSAAGNDVEAKKKTIEARLNDLADKGYGGIVTNVLHNNNYLHDKEAWELFRHSLKYAVQKHNMKVWLYDEKGYPSGGAGGLTLKDNPQYECKALVMIKKEVTASEQISVEMPRGHNKFESVYMIDHCGIVTDLSGKVSRDGKLVFSPDLSGTLYCFASKRLYEGTHAQHNVCAARRYISLTNKAAVAAFIDNTYKKYMDMVKDLNLPRENLPAFFTDEPSMQCCYLNAGLTPPVVDDPYDDEIPLLALVAWENDILNIYEKRYAENLKFKLHYLFGGDSAEALSVRYNYYTMISDLYEEAFFKQISEFCKEHSIDFSGHILLEENVLHHAIFEGNFFNLLRHMHIPGIDMLFTKPKSVIKYAATPKLVSSVAAWYGRKHVMSEISGHTETALGIPFDFGDILCAQYVQFVLGVDIFNSYFNDNALSVTENRTLCSALDRLCNEFEAKQDMSDVLVYYPIESAQASLIGSDKQLHEREYSDSAKLCEETWRETIDELIKNQNMFHCADTTVIASAKYSAEKKSLVNPGCDAEYKVLILPRPAVITNETLRVLTDLVQRGFCVIAIDFAQNTPVIGSDGSTNIIDDKFFKKVVHVKDAKGAVKAANEIISREYSIVSESDEIISLAKKDVQTGEILCFIVNTGEAEAKVHIECKNYSIKYMNPEDGLWYNAEEPDLVIEAKKGIIVKF